MEQFPCAGRLHDLKRTRCPLGFFFQSIWFFGMFMLYIKCLLNGRYVMHWFRIWSFERKHTSSYFIKITSSFIHSSSKSNNFQLVWNDFKCYGSLTVDQNGASLQCWESWTMNEMKLVWNAEKVGQWMKGGKSSNEWTCEIDTSWGFTFSKKLHFHQLMNFLKFNFHEFIPPKFYTLIHFPRFINMLNLVFIEHAS